MNKNNILIEAAKLGCLELVETCLECGADVAAYSNEALRWAAKYEHKDVEAYLRSLI